MKLKNIKIWIYLFFLFIYNSAGYPQIKAFPEAEGFGAYAAGGRGGRVIK